MAYITGPSILATKDAGGTVIVAANTALRFVGASVTADGPSQTLISVGASAVTASNLGGGTGVFAAIVGTDLQFKSLIAGTGISLSSTASEITINGSTDTASNLGTGEKVFASKVGSDFQFKSLVAGTGISLSSTASEITINGSTDTASNLGTGEKVFASKVGSDFQFKSLVAGSGISLSSTASEITISAGAGTYWSLSGNTLAGGNFLGSVNNQDVILIRNNIEFIRLEPTGISFNGSTVYNFNYTNNTASVDFGYRQAGSTITSSGISSLAFGKASGVSIISSSGNSSYAAGDVDTTSSILSSGSASFAHGAATNSSQITAGNTSSVTFGSCSGSGITNVGIASLVGGTDLGGTILSNVGASSIIWGDSINNIGSQAQVFGKDHSTGSDFITVFGLNHTINAYGVFIIGQFGNVAGVNYWDPVSEAFVLGNGSSSLARNNSFTIYKDGKLKTDAAQVNQALTVQVSSFVLSARTDYKILLNDAAAGVNTINLPPGELGLEYRFMPTAANTGSWSLVPNGIDTLDGNIPANLGTATSPISISFIGGTWYQI